MLNVIVYNNIILLLQSKQKLFAKYQIKNLGKSWDDFYLHDKKQMFILLALKMSTIYSFE